MSPEPATGGPQLAANETRSESTSRTDALALAMSAVAVVTCVGWLMERRRRLARQEPAPSDSTFSELPLVVGTPAAGRAPLRLRIGSSGQKKLIEMLLWLRAAARASGILAAIGIAVFWSIDASDPAGRESSLIVGLFGLFIASWLAFWGLGYVANSLHRKAFNRIHPKFDN